jgi:hypothetical protein
MKTTYQAHFLNQKQKEKVFRKMQSGFLPELLHLPGNPEKGTPYVSDSKGNKFELTMAQAFSL